MAFERSQSRRRIDRRALPTSASTREKALLGDNGAATELPRADLRVDFRSHFFQIPQRGQRGLVCQVQQDVEPVDGRPDAGEFLEVLLHFGERHVAKAPCDDQGPGDVDRINDRHVTQFRLNPARGPAEPRAE